MEIPLLSGTNANISECVIPRSTSFFTDVLLYPPKIKILPSGVGAIQPALRGAGAIEPAALICCHWYVSSENIQTSLKYL